MNFLLIFSFSILSLSLSSLVLSLSFLLPRRFLYLYFRSISLRFSDIDKDSSSSSYISYWLFCSIFWKLSMWLSFFLFSSPFRYFGYMPSLHISSPYTTILLFNTYPLSASSVKKSSSFLFATIDRTILIKHITIASINTKNSSLFKIVVFSFIIIIIDM